MKGMKTFIAATLLTVVFVCGTYAMYVHDHDAGPKTEQVKLHQAEAIIANGWPVVETPVRFIDGNNQHPVMVIYAVRHRPIARANSPPLEKLNPNARIRAVD